DPESGADADGASGVPARQRDDARGVVHGRAHDRDDRSRDARDDGPIPALRRRARSVVSAARTKPAAPLVRAACAAWLAAGVAACGGEPSEFPELRPGPATAADEAALDEFDRRY